MTHRKFDQVIFTKERGRQAGLVSPPHPRSLFLSPLSAAYNLFDSRSLVLSCSVSLSLHVSFSFDLPVFLSFFHSLSPRLSLSMSHSRIFSFFHFPVLSLILRLSGCLSQKSASTT